MPELSGRGGLVRDVAWILGTLLVLGVLAAVVWSQVAHPPYFVRTTDNAVMEQAQLGKQIRVDGLYVVIGLVGGLLAGLGLAALRRRDPLLVVLLGVAASIGAGLVALHLGERLGHRDVAALAHAAKPGAHVADTVRVISGWVVAAWPFGFLIGALAVLLASPDDASSGDGGDHGSEQGDQSGGRDPEVDATTSA